MSALGIDISTWQAVTPNLTGLDFVICRATFGSGKDTRYDYHSANVLAAGKVLGAYCFGRSGHYVSIASQVAATLSVAGNAHFFAIDVEKDGSNTYSMTATEAADWIARMKAADPKKRRIVLYHSLSGFPSVTGDGRWIAKWSTTPPTLAYVIWQNADTYKGSSAGGDSNVFHGTAADLRAWLGATPAPGGTMAQFVQSNGYGTGSLKSLHVPSGSSLYKLDGTLLKTLSTDANLVCFGLVDAQSGQYLVRIATGNVYADKVIRDTLVLVKTTATPTDVPPPVTGDYATGYKDAKTKAASAVGGI